MNRDVPYNSAAVTMSSLWETVSKTEVHTDGVWPCLKELYKSGEPSGEPVLPHCLFRNSSKNTEESRRQTSTRGARQGGAELAAAEASEEPRNGFESVR